MIGWLVSALIENIAHPIALVAGGQGTGKSKAAGFIVSLVDPSTVPLRAEPRNIDDWCNCAVHCWVNPIDNLSRIKPWFSDALCRTVTGDGMVRRKLFHDCDISVVNYRRCVLLTSIEPGALRGDLGERLILLELEQILPKNRKTEADLEEQFAALYPYLVGALLDIAAKVHQAMPKVRLPGLPRMADFAKVLAALDSLDMLDGKSLQNYLRQSERISEGVVDDDPVADAVRKFIEALPETNGTKSWAGTATELYDKLTPEKPQRGWPKNASVFGKRLTRAEAPLRQVGVVAERQKSDTAKRDRIITISTVKSAGDDPLGPHLDAPNLFDDLSDAPF